MCIEPPTVCSLSSSQSGWNQFLSLPYSEHSSGFLLYLEWNPKPSQRPTRQSLPPSPVSCFQYISLLSIPPNTQAQSHHRTFVSAVPSAEGSSSRYLYCSLLHWLRSRDWIETSQNYKSCSSVQNGNLCKNIYFYFFFTIKLSLEMLFVARILRFLRVGLCPVKCHP